MTALEVTDPVSGPPLQALERMLAAAWQQRLASGSRLT
jgi:hypothetical protein